MTLELQEQRYKPTEQTSSDRALTTRRIVDTAWEMVFDNVARLTLQNVQNITEAEAMRKLFDKPGETLLQPNEIFTLVTSETQQTFGTIMNIFAHPGSDGTDFNFGITANIHAHLTQRHIPTTNMFYELSLTSGEAGWEGHTAEQTKEVRIKQAQIAAKRLEIQLEIADLPDFHLLTLGNLEIAKNLIKERLKIIKPSIIFTHSPVIDHPDHVATYIATVIALEELSQEDPEYSPPALYTVTPEFAHRSEQPWAVNPVNKLYQELEEKKSNGNITEFEQNILFALQLTTDSINNMKASDPIIPQMLVDITDFMDLKMRSLFLDYTQLSGKDYAELIPILALLFGITLEKCDPKKFDIPRSGEPITQEIIPGVTNERNELPAYLLPGTAYQFAAQIY